MLNRESAFRGWRFCPVSLIFLGLDHFRIKYLDANFTFDLKCGDKMNREPARVESGERCGGGALTLEEGNRA